MLARIPAILDYPKRVSGAPRPLISVVTTVLNGQGTISRTIASVRDQRLPGLEYIIVDAGSSDGTINILKANSDIIDFWISEGDQGISDGFNKGIALSSGNYVLILNADDWLSSGQLATGIEALEKTQADFVFGDLIYYSVASEALFKITGDYEYHRRLPYVMPALNHPTVIVRRSAYERCGLFDMTLRFAMDYELLLRFHKAGLRGVYEPRIVGHMSLDGASDRNTGAALREVRQISIRHGYLPFLAWMRYLLRLLKWRGRLLAQKLPDPLFDRLRGLFNRNYSATR